MKIIFFGHDEISLSVLEMIRKSNELLSIVLPSNRSKTQINPLKKFAKYNKIRYFQPKSPNDLEFVEKMRRLKPELAIVYNYSHIFQKAIINIFPKGMINFHGALLPQYQGANVINWTIINGEKKSGVTAHYITEKIDAGPVVKQVKFPIKLTDTAWDVKQKIARITPDLANDILEYLRGGSLKAVCQRGKATYYQRRKPEDGRINFQKGAEEIYNLTRALVYPWSGAYAYYGRKKIVFERVKLINFNGRGKSGEILAVNRNGIIIATGSGNFILKKIRLGNQDKDPSMKSFRVGKFFR